MIDLSPQEFAAELGRRGGRGYLVTPPDMKGVVASDPWLEDLARLLNGDARDYQGHEAVFLAVGPETGALFGAFVHDSRRGQSQGGLRHWPYESLEGFLRDGLRLSLGMSRKCALAGLHWGGGKGLIARQDERDWKDPAYRQQLYREYGRFVSSLRGLYVTAEDVGTSPSDMAAVYQTTRHVTCVPEEVGGSGNPSRATALGVAAAMAAALQFTGRGSLAGKTVVLQGAGNVAGFLVERLLELQVGRVVASELSADRLQALRELHPGAPLELRQAAPGDDSILAEACDVLAPCALGGVLNPQTIPRIQAPIVCGAANNQLLDDRRDDAALAARDIVYVPDFVANRMGIVSCANEQYGAVPADPAIQRHYRRDWDGSVFAVTQRVLARARDGGLTTSQAANALADEACRQLHPLWGHRGREIARGLVQDRWQDQGRGAEEP